MEPMRRFRHVVEEIFDQVMEKEQESLRQAAQVIAGAIEKDQLVHVFGTGGHSAIGAMEMFYRAGGLACINPLFPPGISNMDSHPSTERLTGYAKHVLDHYGVKGGEVLIIVNVNGINAVTIDAALEAKQRGATVIAVTSVEFASNVPPNIPARHPSNKNLHELADIVIDVHVPLGDAVLELPGFDQKVASVSTVIVAFVLQGLVALVVEELLKRGVEPPVWKSANLPGGDEANRRWIAKYFSRVRHLYSYS